MTAIDRIGDEVRALVDGVGGAAQRTRAVDDAIEGIIVRAAGAGFTGTAAGLGRARQATAQIHALLVATSGVLAEVSRAVTAVADQATPGEVISTLTRVGTELAAVDINLTSAVARIERTMRLVNSALQGGQPDETLSRLRQLGQGIAAILTSTRRVRH
ncbi:DUF6244 family protein [Micromonospora fluostatini]|uniref:DUF6244 family protein n=1 Tax=Micromonospora sp. JCM 30529 TaxID=3421643 RepID=UPI003D1641F2